MRTKAMRLRTSFQRGTAFAALGEFSTTAANFCLRYTRDELCESGQSLRIIGKIGQRLDIINDELSNDRGPTVRK